MKRSIVYSLLISGMIFGNQSSFGQMAEALIDENFSGNVSTLEGYVPSMAVTQDGKTAYFSQASYQKPLYGVFSKKELVHEIYRAEKVNGQWANFTKLEVCPNHYSAKHPAISADGKRLFFASNMRGSYGKYDIYVAEIDQEGKVGVSKNLGPKVNTKEDDLYPSIYNGTLLFFASKGHEGFGGLDLYAAQVFQNTVTPSVNLGDHINSDSDDYAIALSTERKMGYVVSNRGHNNTVSQFTVAYGNGLERGTLLNLAQAGMGLQTVMNTESHDLVGASLLD